MELNGIACLGYQPTGNIVSFVLDCDYAEPQTLDGQELKVTADGEDVAVFGGYRLLSTEVYGEHIRARFGMKLEPNVEQALSGITRNVEIAARDAKSAGGRADAAQEGARTANATASEASTLANANAEAIEEMAAIVFAE